MSMPINSPPQPPVIVGIGASAGGLEAFQLLLKGLPDEHQLVLVLIQHLDPDHESLMPELVAAKTKSPVQSVTDGIKVEPGQIYLMPPGYEMEIKGDRLQLFDFAKPRGLRRPIDRFFKSLAAECGERSCAVVLSGTGSDGADGAREVKGQGGLVLVQEPTQAKYDGMPQSVLDLSGADVISDAEEIIDVVRDYFSLRVDVEGELNSSEEFLDRILRHVRYRTGYDFADYKEATMLRRVAVRMSVLDIASPEDYLKYIVDSKGEAKLLFRDLLINVTSFFRDADHFDTLKNEVLPKLVEAADDHSDLRIWVAGCSTGEEVYSLAILVAEELSRVSKSCNVVIFGTDIDEQALATARLGRYADTLMDAVPDTFRERYFRASEDGYEVGPELREMVRFSRHSFIKDPPFSKLDLVTCRNVLIYLRDNLQDLSIRVFHYALREGGFLFLGPSENPKTVEAFFHEKEGRSRIFQRKDGRAKPLNLGGLSGSTLSHLPTPPKDAPPAKAISDLEQVLLAEFAPAYLQADLNNEILYASENARRYLAVRAGKMSINLFDFVSPELEATFRRAARTDSKVGALAEIEFQGEINGTRERLIVSSRRMEDGSQLFVIRDNLELMETRPNADLIGSQASYVTQLEAELDKANRAVRTTVEELETSNEELKSSNEEMMSMNEELQSANEELSTINDELQEKLRELNQSNVDLKNFVQSARVPTVFLDADLKLLRFTPEAQAFFSFSDGDIGRSMTDLNAEIDQERLLILCARTVAEQIEQKEEFETKDGTISLSVRIMPYSPDGMASRGAVFTLQDVSALRDAVDAADEATALAELQKNEVEQVYATSPLAMGLIDSDMVYLRLNDRLAEINGVPVEQHMGRRIRDIIPAVADQTEKLVNQVLTTETPVLAQRVVGSTTSEPDRMRVWESDWMPFYKSGELSGVSVIVRDITEEVETAEKLREIMRELEHRVKNMLSNVNALINRAAREADTDTEVFETLSKRVRGLANTHALLTAESWSSAMLKSIFSSETVDVYGADRVALSGPDMWITSDATLSLAMAIHELATNAAKYGAFSVAEGRVDISWSRIFDAQGDRLRIEWVETGGPEISPPSRSGFGSQLVKSTLEGSLSGQVDYDWEPNGLRVVINLEFGEVTVPQVG